MTKHRKFLYRAQAVTFATLGFIALAQYSQWHVSPEGQKAHMDAIHAQALADHYAWKRQQVMALWNISEDYLTKPVDLFNEKGSL